MRLVAGLLLSVVATVGLAEPSLRAMSGVSSRRPSGGDLQRSPTSPQIAEPVSLRTLQQQLANLQMKLDLVAGDVSYTRQRLDQTSRNLDTLTKYLFRTSCSDAPPEDSPPGGGISLGGRRPSVGRQTSMDGVFAIYPPNGSPKRVMCDNGWTVVLLRQDGSLNFNRSYEDYEDGFGDPSGEVWIGLETLHSLTSSRPHQLRVEMTNFEGKSAVALYANFSVGDARSFYRLRVGGLQLPFSTAGDALKDHNNMAFSTVDADHDTDKSNCAQQFGGGGGWWYAQCYVALGTGKYRRPSRSGTRVVPEYGGVTWHPFSDVKQSLKTFRMMIKPRDL